MPFFYLFLCLIHSKGLLPECRESGVNKAAVLSAAVRTIERYQLFIEETNKERLKAEALNKRLKIEANSLAGSPHTPATDLYLAQLNAGQPVVPRQAGDFASLPSDAAYSEADYMDQFEFQEDGEYHSASPYSHSHGFEQHEW